MQQKMLVLPIVEESDGPGSDLNESTRSLGFGDQQQHLEIDFPVSV